MIRLVAALRWLARIDGAVALVLGLLLWSGSNGSLKVHILTGFVMTFILLIIGILGISARINPPMPSIALLFAILLPFVGFGQLKWMVGSGHIVVQILHLLIGVGAIGVVEAVGAKITRASRT